MPVDCLMSSHPTFTKYFCVCRLPAIVLWTRPGLAWKSGFARSNACRIKQNQGIESLSHGLRCASRMLICWNTHSSSKSYLCKGLGDILEMVIESRDSLNARQEVERNLNSSYTSATGRLEKSTGKRPFLAESAQQPMKAGDRALTFIANLLRCLRTSQASTRVNILLLPKKLGHVSILELWREGHQPLHLRAPAKMLC